MSAMMPVQIYKGLLDPATSPTLLFGVYQELYNVSSGMVILKQMIISDFNSSNTNQTKLNFFIVNSFNQKSSNFYITVNPDSTTIVDLNIVMVSSDVIAMVHADMQSGFSALISGIEVTL